VRISLASRRSSATPNWTTVNFVLARQLNFETIHSHESGWRSVYGHRRRASAASCTTGNRPRRHTELRQWARGLAAENRKGDSPWPAAQAVDVGRGASHHDCESPLPRRNAITGHGLPEAAQRWTGTRRERRRSRRARRKREEQEGHDPDGQQPIPPTIGATPRNAPPQVATTLPPRCHRRNNGRQCPEHRRPPPAEDTGEMRNGQRRDERGCKALQGGRGRGRPEPRGFQP